MGNLHEVDIVHRVRPAQYDRFQKGTAAQLARIAKPLRGLRVLHVNSTAHGGGVAELLESQIPFERALGIKSHWFTIDAPDAFFKVTKRLHDLLQGGKSAFGPRERRIYLETTKVLGESVREAADVLRSDLIVLHDPQTLGAAHAAAERAPVIARLHGDLLTPNPRAASFVEPFLGRADRVVVSSKEYMGHFPSVSRRRVSVVYPAIDPLVPKNALMENPDARAVLRTLGVRETGPLIAQVSRFDPWKDPVGVIRAYRIAKRTIPRLQLVLLGLFLAKDDPEAAAIFARARTEAKGDPDIFLFADPRLARRLSDATMVRAAYAGSDVVIQKSIREGFGLTMTEAMWQGRPLVAGRTTGARIQVRNGRNGILVDSPKEAADAIVRLFHEPARAQRLGRAAHESVRRSFLMPRFVADNIKIYRALMGGVHKER
jgi:trehalose synthase